jgi:hypothetical protein
MASFLFHPFMEKGLANVTDAVRGTILPDRGSVSDDNPVWVNFARGMAPLQMPSAGVIAQLAAGSGPIKVLDIAAGHGMFGITVAQQMLRAEGTVVNRGRTVGYAECTITDEENRLVAKAACTCMVLRGQKAAGR